eukprot:CAMPEP_0196723382 /NCGR_PEP_ID=MMETSP1091-20130531/5512_1 /TAXON_ID=302021 /ORGANISM="Rhodomonas sp., Strain CCMP768" /LENGTH=69 /DNA_ID=CAMNT_0042065295 /DNA_START=32 /DNA_END=241 /DNA_ORIENTATION=+
MTLENSAWAPDVPADLSRQVAKLRLSQTRVAFQHAPSDGSSPFELAGEARHSLLGHAITMELESTPYSA